MGVRRGYGVGPRGVDARVERLTFSVARWVEGEALPLAELESQLHGYGAIDIHGNHVVLFKGEWQLEACAKAFPKTRFVELGSRAAQIFEVQLDDIDSAITRRAPEFAALAMLRRRILSRSCQLFISASSAL